MKILSKKDIVRKIHHRTPYISITAGGAISFNPAAVRYLSLEPGVFFLLATDDDYPGKLLMQKTRIDDDRAWRVSRNGARGYCCRASVILRRLDIDFENYIYSCKLTPAPQRQFVNWYIMEFEKRCKRSKKK